MTRIELTFRNKYRTTARLTRSESGTLLDIGSRDRVLSRYLARSPLTYISAERGDQSDFYVDLEHPLAQFADQRFDVVAALDVLEHVDHFHAAFAELLRITRTLAIIALPSLSSYYHRLSFLLRGRLGTDKYDLPLAPPLDRHRWLTVADNVARVIPALASQQGFSTETVVYELEGGQAARLALYPIARLIPPLRGLLATRVVFALRRIS